MFRRFASHARAKEAIMQPIQNTEISRRSSNLFSAREVAQTIGADLETINEWLEVGAIDRAVFGGGRFSKYELQRAALTLELVKLGLAPSCARAVVIPIVFTQVADPVGSGFVSNYAQPNGNITGFADFDPSVGGKWLEVLKEAAPRIDHVTVFSDPDQINHERFLRAIEAAAPRLKPQIAVVTARSRAEIEQVIANVARQADGGVIVLPGPLYNVQRASIIEAA